MSKKTIICDTREKVGKNLHVLRYFDKVRQPYVRSKLLTGDYTYADNQSIVIDRKQNLDELAGNLTTGHARFKNELLLAQKCGITLVVLIEEPLTLDMVDNWSSRHTALKGSVLKKIMITMAKKYNVEWQFCSIFHTGEQILKILKGGNK